MIEILSTMNCLKHILNVTCKTDVEAGVITNIRDYMRQTEEMCQK